jgi:energy-coupling factor transporter ATP-binding protein EcfA2
MSDREVVAVLNDVSYCYQGTTEPALTSVSLEIRRGEFLALVGPTCAGKTTLCRVFNGTVPQFLGGRFFGKATVAGLDTLENSVSRLATHVGMVLDDPDTQLVTTSVENEVAFALENLGVPRVEMRDRIHWSLRAVGLEGNELKRPQDLSGGQKQRLAIAAALALQPELLVLDEPTSQLDSLGAREVLTTVRELQQEFGVAVVMASHAAEWIVEYADQVLVMRDGRPVASGAPAQVYSRVELLESCGVRLPQVTRTFSLIGCENILGEGRLPTRLEDGVAAVRLLAQRCHVRCPAPEHSIGPTQVAPLASAVGVTYVYPDGTQALSGVNLDIGPGEYLLLVGQNGAGKTTLVRQFLGLLKPREGFVNVGCKDVRDWSVSALARQIGYVAQNPDTQLFASSVESEVAFGLEGLDLDSAALERQVYENIGLMGLRDYRDRHPFSLPRGLRARVVMAAVLAMRPRMLILDEPFRGQDALGVARVLDATRQLHDEGGAVVVVTHDLKAMPGCVQRVVAMDAGKIVLDALPRQVLYAVPNLESAGVDPPDVVVLSRALGEETGQHCHALTPAQLASFFQCDAGGECP